MTLKSTVYSIFRSQCGNNIAALFVQSFEDHSRVRYLDLSSATTIAMIIKDLVEGGIFSAESEESLIEYHVALDQQIDSLCMNHE